MALENSAHQSNKGVINLRTEVRVRAPTVEDHIQVFKPGAFPSKTKLSQPSCIVLSAFEHQHVKYLN